VKILAFYGYNDEADESDENYFEMIAEHGEIVDVDSVNDLHNSKMPPKIFPCHTYPTKAMIKKEVHSTEKDEDDDDEDERKLDIPYPWCKCIRYEE
jgi:hypothetical protein